MPPPGSDYVGSRIVSLDEVKFGCEERAESGWANSSSDESQSAKSKQVGLERDCAGINHTCSEQ